MPDQKLTFGVNLDLNGFDQGVNKVKNQLKELERAKDTLGRSANTLQGEGQMGSYAKQAYGSFMQESKQGLNNQFASQKKEMTHNMVNLRALQSEQRELEKIQKIEKDLTKEKRDRLLLIKQETQALIERQKQLTNDAAAVKQTLGRFSDDGSGGDGGKSGSVQEIQKDPKRGIVDLLKSVSVAAIIRGAINSAEFIVNKEQGSLRASGQAAAVASQEMGEERQGQGFKGIFYAEQRKKAMQMALKKKEGQSGIDFAKIGGTIGGMAATGTMFGGAWGGAGGALLGLGSVLSNEQLTARMTSPDHYKKLMTKQGMQDYKANYAAEKALNPTRTFAEKAFSRDSNEYLDLQLSGGFNDKGLLGESIEDKSLKNQLDEISNVPMARKKTFQEQSREAIGLGAGSDRLAGDMTKDVFSFTGQGPLAPENGGLQADSLLKNLFNRQKEKEEQKISLERKSQGYLQDQMAGTFDNESNQIFKKEDILSKRKQIIAQGGTDDQHLARSASKAARNLGVKDAGSVFGKLAGAGGGFDSAKSEDAFKRIMTNAVKSGVDLSKMPVELNRFAKVAVELATKGGGFSESAVDVLSRSTQGFGVKDLQAGASSYEDAKKRGKQDKGFRSQIGFGVMLGDEGKDILGEEAQKKLKGMTKVMQNINNLSSEDLDKSPYLAKGGAEAIGTTEEKFRKLVATMESKKQLLLPGSSENIKELTKETEGMTKEQRAKWIQGKGAKNMFLADAEMNANIGGFGQQDTNKRTTDIFTLKAFGNRSAENLDVAKQVNDKYNTDKKTALTELDKSKAVGQITDIKGLNKHIEALGESAKNHSESAELYNRTFKLFIEALDNGGDAIEKIASKLGGVADNLDFLDSSSDSDTKTNSTLIPTSKPGG